MTYEEYIKELARRKLNADNSFVADMGAIEGQAYDILDVWIDNTLEIKNGYFIGNAETTSLLNQFSDEYVRSLMQIGEYKGSVTSYLKDLDSTAGLMKEFQTSQGFDLSKANIGEAQNLVVNEIIDAYTENGLNAHFVQPLRDLLYQNVAGSTRVQDAKAYLKSYVKGGNDKSGKLDRYITQTAQQGVDSYTGAINTKLMSAFNYNGLIISGSLIKTSSPQCRFAVDTYPNGEFTKKQFDNEIKPIALLNGLISGTTFKNLPFNKLHHGCRHEFTPVMIKT
jgi:hypothetical protein